MMDFLETHRRERWIRRSTFAVVEMGARGVGHIDVLCAVAEYGDFHDSIVPRIAALRTHPSPEVRFTVTTRLSIHIDHPAARRALAELARDEDDTVRDMARESMDMYRSFEQGQRKR